MIQTSGKFQPKWTTHFCLLFFIMSCFNRHIVMIGVASSKILSLSFGKEPLMEILTERTIIQRGRFISLLCLLTVFVTGCSSTAKIKESEPFLRNSNLKEEDEPYLGKFILKSAMSQLRQRYKFGGTSPQTGFDCSGLSWYSHKTNAINIPRQSSDQFKGGKRISQKDLRPGDLVFFETYRPGASHVGIYTGDGNFIHALNRNKNVAIQSLSNNYYKKRYLGARRYW